jgi:hypothetical protein
VILSQRPLVRALAGLAVLVLWLQPVHAQQMEPRSYSNAPVGLNFLIAGYAHSQGDVLVDPSVTVDNGHAKIDTLILGYARTLDFWGQSGTIALALPYAWVSANGELEGQQASVSRSGFGDPVLRVSVNLYGAPSLSMKSFHDYQQDTIVGASLLIAAPWGHYDSMKLVNVGTNRWSVKPEVGVSKALGKWALEAAAGVTFFTDNDQYLGARTLRQDPLYAVQGHLIYTFDSGLWAALDTTYYAGGRTSVDGGVRNDLQQSWRTGATLSKRLDPRNSVKFYFSSGAIARTGTDFDTLGIAWQYLWGAGI